MGPLAASYARALAFGYEGPAPTAAEEEAWARAQENEDDDEGAEARHPDE